MFNKKYKYSTGAVKDNTDPRDKPYDEVAFGSSDVDWEKGFDIEKKYGFTIPFKDQGSSGSCFPPGTKVLMEDLSYKEIQKIHVGEKVITHKNRIRTVTETMKRKWQGTMFTIKPYGEFPITASPEHPFLLDDGSWVAAKDLKEDQFIVIPKTKNIIKDKLDYDFEYDNDFLWSIGFYLAEGSLDTYGINYSIHKDEIEYVDKIKSVFKKFGTNVSTYNKKDSLGITINVFGKIWSERFLEYGSKLCFNKKLNKKFLTLSPDKQLNILIGWMDGDGSYKKDTFIGVTTSKELVRQMNDIAKRNGIRTAIRKRKKEDGRLQVYELQFGKRASMQLFGNDQSGLQNNYSKEDDNNFYVKIDKIKKIKAYTGENIYNIEVEDDHSYIVENIAVHNCVGQGWAYYVAVLNAIEVGYYSDVSAKSIYSLIELGMPGGGAYIRDGGKLITNWGALMEMVLSSYMDGNVPTETFMKDKTWKTPELDNLAKTLQAKEYRTIIASNNMDLFAKAIRDNNGVVGGVQGGNDGSWRTNEPQIPTSNIWQHCIFYGKYGTDEDGKYIATPNSWGTRKKDDLHLDGWQKLRQDYFNAKYQFNPWTLIDKPNNGVTDPVVASLINKYEKKIVTEGEGHGRQGIIIDGKLLELKPDRKDEGALYILTNNNFGTTVPTKTFDSIPKGKDF